MNYYHRMILKQLKREQLLKSMDLFDKKHKIGKYKTKQKGIK